MKILSTFFVLFICLSVKAQPELSLYYVTVSSQQLQSDDLKTQLLSWGAEKAAYLDLGAKYLGKPYFHFFIDETKSSPLFAYLKSYGETKIEKYPQHTKNPAGKARFILWLDPKKNLVSKAVDFDLIQSVEDLNHTTEMMSPWLDPTITPKSKRLFRLTVKKEDYLKFMFERLKEGPLQVQNKRAKKNQKMIDLQVLFSPKKKGTPQSRSNKTDIELSISPTNLTDYQQLSQTVKKQYKVVFQKKNENQELLYFKISKEELTDFVYTYSASLALMMIPLNEDLENKEKYFIRFRLQKPDSVLLAWDFLNNKKRALAAIDDVPKILTKQEEFRVKQKIKHVTEIHFAGSAIPVKRKIVSVVDVSLQHWFDYFGARVHALQTSNEVPETYVQSTEFAAQYRFPIGAGKLGQSVITSLHYKNIKSQGPEGNFVGAGVSYTDDMWPAIDNLINLIPFLNYPKTVELNLEYLPFSTTPGVSGITAYVFSLKGMLFINPQFSIEAGYYNHFYKFEKDDGASKLDNRIQFGEVGIGYRF